MQITALFRRIAVSALVVGGFVTASAVPVYAGSASAATVVTVPLTLEPDAYADVEACIGESITVTGGEYRLVLAHRGTQWLFHANTVGGLAIGSESGATYKIIGHQQEVVANTTTGAYVDTFQLRLRVVGTLGAPSFSAHAYFHLTITPSGATVERGAFVIDC